MLGKSKRILPSTRTHSLWDLQEVCLPVHCQYAIVNIYKAYIEGSTIISVCILFEKYLGNIEEKSGVHILLHMEITKNVK